MASKESVVVAKFGGTSMAHPDRVMQQLAHPENDAQVVVVSAPGKARKYPIKTTDMLLGYQQDQFAAKDIVSRFSAVGWKLDLNGRNNEMWELVRGIPDELQQWNDAGWPVEALGEYWSAKIFAIHSGREFVDARELFIFGEDGKLAQKATSKAMNQRLERDGRYVVPGFYGSGPNGEVMVFPRGGSDISVAAIARFIKANRCDIWSDVEGFMSADPRKVPEAQLIKRATHREGRELSNGGSELLHREVIRYLGRSNIKTMLRNTFGEPDAPGTMITRRRPLKDRPIVGVTGRDDMIELSLHEFGLNEEVGDTLAIYQALNENGVPYEHTATGTDDVSVFVSGNYAQQVLEVADNLRRPGRRILTRTSGLLHIVGEGLIQADEARSRALGSVCTALAEAGINTQGVTDVAGSASMTIFVEPGSVDEAMRVAHNALGLGD